MAGSMLALALAVQATGVFAQSIPVAPPTREEVERVPVRPVPDRRARLEVESDLPAAPCTLDDPRYAEIRVRLDRVEYEGLRQIPPGLLADAHAGLLGTDQPVSVLCRIRDRATALLNRAGYLAAVEIPEQSLGDGEAQLRIVLGRIVAVRVRGEAGPSRRQLAAYLRRLTQDDVFNRDAAERHLLLAGDMPGYDVRLSLRSAGTAPGELIGEVAVLRTSAAIVANVQNYGSDALGPVGGLVSAEYYGLTGLGDRTTLTAFTTADFHEQQTLQVGHDFLIGSDGLALSAQLTGSRGNPDVGLANVDVDSTTLIATLQLSYPFIRTRRETVRGAIGFDLVDQDVRINDLDLTRDRLRVLFGRLSVDAVDAGSLAYRDGYSPAEPRLAGRAFVEFRQGVDMFGASPDCRAAPLACLGAGRVPPSRILADPTGSVLRFAGSVEYRPHPQVVLVAEARAQRSDSGLLPFEEFSAGNFTIGRGYDPGTLLGDSGIGTSLELRFGRLAPATREEFTFQPYAFFETARVWNEDPTAGDRRLSALGGGVRAVWGDRLQADITLAVPLERAGLQADRGDVRLLFTLTTKLLPWSFQ